MRFSNFLFPESATPEHDFAVIHETLQEVELCDQLGFYTIWLAEQVAPVIAPRSSGRETL
jgi:hypothetical protein